MAAWVDRLDDKEFICFSCHNLFPYFDLMSRMAVWKEQLGRTGFGSADQPVRALGLDGSKVANGLRCAEPEGDGLGSEVLGWLGSNALGSEALAGKALARRPLVRKVIARERSLPEKHWPEWNWSRRCWDRRRWPEKRWHLSKELTDQFSAM